MAKGQSSSGANTPSTRRRPDISDKQASFEFTFPSTKPIRLLSPDELYENLSQTIAVDASEDPRIERKPAAYNARALGDYFSMWANTSSITFTVPSNATLSHISR